MPNLHVPEAWRPYTRFSTRIQGRGRREGVSPTPPPVPRALGVAMTSCRVA